MDIGEAIKWINDNGSGLQGVGTMVAGAAAVITLIVSQRSKPAANGKASEHGDTVPSPLLAQAADRLSLDSENGDRDRAMNVPPKPTRPRRSAEKIIADLQALRASLTPPPLSAAAFPPGLSVMRFVPGEILSIRLPGTQGILKSGGWFSFVHFAFLPGAFGALIFGHMFVYIGGALGLAWWWHLMRRGAVAKIKLRERSWAVTSVVGGFWGAGIPNNVSIEREHKDGRWLTKLVFGGQTLWEHVSSDEDAGAKLAEPFLEALRAELGLPVEIAEGILILPSRK